MLAHLTLPAPGAPLEKARTRRVQVRSAGELRQALREARDRPVTLDASALDCVLHSDDERRLLEVQGAMTWRSLVDGLAPLRERLAPWTSCPGLPATVAEAVSLDAPGPDGAPLAACVEAVTLVTVDGELRRADRSAHPSLFRLAVGGQGVFGLLYSVTLRVDALLRAAEEAEPSVTLDLPVPEGCVGVRYEVEALLPIAEVEGFVSAARRLAAERRVALRSAAVRRLRAGPESALGWARRDWAGVSIGLDMRATLGASVNAAEIRRLIHAAAIERGGSFPPRAACHASREQLACCYPAIAEFLAEKRRYDPAERLQNSWYRCVTALVRRPACESRWGN